MLPSSGVLIMGPKQEPIISEEGGYAGSRSTITDEQRPEIVELAEAGVGRNEIARRTGIRPATVSLIVAGAGLGFAERARTAGAVQARVAQLQMLRIDQGERLHLTLDQLNAVLVMAAREA